MIPLRDDNVATRAPVVTRTIVGLCVLVFLWQMTLGTSGQAVVFALGVIPAVLLGREALPPELALVPPWCTVITSMFMHGGSCTCSATCCICGYSATTSKTA
jgi:membrane associated rhomboid family serine protease